MQDPRAAYLESEVMTATPQKLRLMLIEGALKFLHRAEAAYELDEPDLAIINDSLTRARNIVSELLSSVKDDGAELTKQVAGIYLFLFQQLAEAQLRRDRGKIREVIEVLEVERATWREVCEQFPEAPEPLEGDEGPQEIVDRGPAIIPQMPTPTADPGIVRGGFSIDA